MQFFPADIAIPEGRDITSFLSPFAKKADFKNTFGNVLSSFIEEDRYDYTGRPAGFAAFGPETGTMDFETVARIAKELRSRKVSELSVGQLEFLAASGSPLTVGTVFNALSGKTRLTEALSEAEMESFMLVLDKLNFSKLEKEEMLGLSDDGNIRGMWTLLSGKLQSMDATADVSRKEWNALLRGLDSSPGNRKSLLEFFAGEAGELEMREFSGAELEKMLAPLRGEYAEREQAAAHARTQARSAIVASFEAAKVGKNAAPVEDVRGSRHLEQKEALMQNSVRKNTGIDRIMGDDQDQHALFRKAEHGRHTADGKHGGEHSFKHGQHANAEHGGERSFEYGRHANAEHGTERSFEHGRHTADVKPGGERSFEYARHTADAEPGGERSFEYGRHADVKPGNERSFEYARHADIKPGGEHSFKHDRHANAEPGGGRSFEYGRGADTEHDAEHSFEQDGDKKRFERTPVAHADSTASARKSAEGVKAEISQTTDTFFHNIHVAADAVRPELNPVFTAQNLNNTAKYFRQEIFSQVEQGILSGMHNGGGRLTLQLNPVELGQVTVILSVHQGEVKAVIRTEQMESAGILREQMAELRAALEAEGLKVKELDVQNSLREELNADQWDGHREHNLMRDADERDRMMRLARIRRDAAGQQPESLESAAREKEQAGLHIVA